MCCQPKTSRICDLRDGVLIEFRTHGFIDQLNGCNGWVVGMVDANLVKSIFGLLQSVALKPVDIAAASAVIEAILRSRCYGKC